MDELPKTKQDYLDEIESIKSNFNTERGTVAMLGLLVEAVVDLKDATEIPTFEYGAEERVEAEVME